MTRRARTRLRLRTAVRLTAADAACVVGAHQPEVVPPADAAAWVLVVRVLVNLDEFVTRGRRLSRPDAATP